MARPKSASSTTSTDEKITVEVADTPKEVIETKEITSPKVETTKTKKTELDDDAIVVIENPTNIYRTVRCNMKTFEFDGEGKVSVTGKDAKAFLKIPGYFLA